MRNLLYLGVAFGALVAHGASAQSSDLAATITNYVNSEVPGGECFSGTCYPLTFAPGDVTVANPGSLTDSNGNTWTLTKNGPVGPGAWWGGIAKNGQQMTDGYDVALRKMPDGSVWIEEAKFGGWWNLSAWQGGSDRPSLGPDPGGGSSVSSQPSNASQSSSIATSPTASSGPCATSGNSGTGSANGYFTTSGTQILDPSGKPWRPMGVNVYGQMLNSAVSDSAGYPLKATWQPLNFIRVPIWNEDLSTGAAWLQPFIATMSALGVVMEIEYHQYPDVQATPGSPAVQFYAQMAASTVGNPYVWYGTENEPDPSYDVNGMVHAIVDAVRGAGNNTIILINQDTPNGLDLSGMTNVAWDQHFYNNDGRYGSQAAADTALSDYIDQLWAVAKIPVVVAEFGDGCCDGVDANWQFSMNAVVNSNRVAGWAAWLYTPPDYGHDVLNNGTTPVGGGQLIANAMAGAPQTSGSYDSQRFAQQTCQLSQQVYPNAAADLQSQIDQAQQQTQQQKQETQQQGQSLPTASSRPSIQPVSSTSQSSTKPPVSAASITGLGSTNPTTPQASSSAGIVTQADIVPLEAEISQMQAEIAALQQLTGTQTQPQALTNSADPTNIAPATAQPSIPLATQSQSIATAPAQSLSTRLSASPVSQALSPGLVAPSTSDTTLADIQAQVSQQQIEIDALTRSIQSPSSSVQVPQTLEQSQAKASALAQAKKKQHDAENDNDSDD